MPAASDPLPRPATTPPKQPHCTTPRTYCDLHTLPGSTELRVRRQGGCRARVGCTLLLPSLTCSIMGSTVSMGAAIVSYAGLGGEVKGQHH